VVQTLDRAACLATTIGLQSLLQVNNNCSRYFEMAKLNPLGVRLEPDTRAALEKAAADDRRSISSMIDRILIEWLRANGYLKPAKK
jgi:hypothetical protein